MAEPKGRPVGGTETSWCRAVPGGTGITVLALHASKPPDVLNLQTALLKVQNSHPILNSRLHTNPKTNTLSFVPSPTPYVQIKSFSLSSTLEILETLYSPISNSSVSPFHLILEHELNQNPWQLKNTTCTTDQDMFFASIYALPSAMWVVALRLHVSACDRTSAVSLLREVVGLMGGGDEGGEVNMEIRNEGEVNLGIEDLIPSGKGKKAMWVRGMDMLSYSVNSLRLTNLKFTDNKSARVSQVVRLQMNEDDTQRVLNGCKTRGIKLCAALVAAGLMAVDKYRLENQKKYGVVTLTDCRSNLHPALSHKHFGFYHSAILNTHTTKGGETLWELANKTYKAFVSSKRNNKHFSDMADLNFLMCKAIDNPTLTSSSSLRASFMSVFEDPVIDDSNDKQRELGLGLEEYMGCASVHGIGPSIAIFDTIRDGRLDCVCVYPAPLHSREQMQGLVDDMKAMLVGCDGNVERKI
ncbi:hypothetical protein PRUPE_7G103700 [Prunus persica]|uniref:Condensation domain-containing protein n=1 Tax=Prunus persica TaxID=3760 RepID=M5W9X5_PRUPE|nr:uncharacterized protein LOC18771018 [Prunus persica]ONH96038.1 hypothetical protein PRUPE_7G103700 [Prunus persica]